MKPVLYIRSGLLTAAILVAAGCSSGNGANTATTAQLAQRPTISAISDQTLAQDSVSAPITFTISDPDNDVSTLSVMARAADGTLIASDGITIAGTGASRTLTLTPTESAFGNTTVTVVVTDPSGAQATAPFAVSVTTMATSFLGFATQTVGADENSQSRAITGLSFTQDADDPTSFDSILTN